VNAYIQMKRLVLDHRFCTIIIYRIIIIPKNMFASITDPLLAINTGRATGLDPLNDSKIPGEGAAANGSVQLGSEDSNSLRSNPQIDIPNIMFQATGAGASIAASTFSSNSST